MRRLIGRDSLVISRNTGEPALMMMMIILGNIDDQHRNPNMNNKDHIVGQLNTGEPALMMMIILGVGF